MADKPDPIDRKASCDAAPDRSCRLTRKDMLRDVGVPVTPERLARAALKGGAPRRQS